MTGTKNETVNSSGTQTSMNWAIWCIVLLVGGLWSLRAEATTEGPEVIEILGVDKADGKLYWTHYSENAAGLDEYWPYLHYVHLGPPRKFATVRSWPVDEIRERMLRLRSRLVPPESFRKGITFSQRVTEVGETDNPTTYYKVQLRLSGEALTETVEREVTTYHTPHVHLREIFTVEGYPFVVAIFRFTGVELEGGYYRDVMVFGERKQP